jgi:hypothetical protein
MNRQRISVIFMSCGLLAGCEAAVLTALGGGCFGGRLTHVHRHYLSYIYRAAAAGEGGEYAGAAAYAYKVVSNGKIDGGEEISASSLDRSIDIELESISSSTTRMRVTAKKNFFIYDSATATEIISQTKKYL